MRLADYLTAEKISDSAFADRIDVSRQTLWRYKNGDRRPEWDVLDRIAQETGGQVTPNDFLEIAAAVAEQAVQSEAAPDTTEAAA